MNSTYDTNPYGFVDSKYDLKLFDWMLSLEMLQTAEIKNLTCNKIFFHVVAQSLLIKNIRE